MAEVKTKENDADYSIKDGKEVDVSRKGLSDLPSEIFEGEDAKTTVKLFAANNGLVRLPETLQDLLPSLCILHISGNKLSSLPPLGRLVSLQKLFAAENELFDWPTDLPASLQHLDLSWNKLTRIPAAVGGLTDLERLSVWENKVTSISSEIGKLKKLKSLWLDGNNITAFPHELSLLPNLEEFHAAGNPIASSVVKAAVERGGPISQLMEVVTQEFEKSCAKVTHAKILLIGTPGNGAEQLAKLLCEPAPVKAKAAPQIRTGGKKQPPSVDKKCGGKVSSAAMAALALAASSEIMVEQHTFVTRIGKRKFTGHVQVVGCGQQYEPALEFFISCSNAIVMVVYNVLNMPQSHLEVWLQRVIRCCDLTTTSLFVIGTYDGNSNKINPKFLEKHLTLVENQLTKISAPIKKILLAPINGVKPQDIQQIRDAIGSCFFKMQRSTFAVHPLLDRVIAQVEEMIPHGEGPSILAWKQFKANLSIKNPNLSESDFRLLTKVMSDAGIITHFDPPDTQRESKSTTEAASTSTTTSQQPITMEQFLSVALKDCVVLSSSALAKVIYTTTKRLSSSKSTSNSAISRQDLLQAITTEISQLIPPE